MAKGNPKILIADDSKNVRKLIAIVLKKEGYKFAEARNGLDALEKVKIEHPDLIILDIILPGMDGLQVCQEIKKDPKTTHIPIIILTTESSYEAREGAHQAGADVYMIKPFEPKDLRTAVKEVLKGKV